MRCVCCGQQLEDKTETCTRCGATLTPAARKRRVAISAAVLVVATALVTLLTYLVLHWHDAQVLS